ncbi:golgin subfamily A member 6-like protein 26 [Macrobrachium nipponense]|uniref:golgin subfamily A member 6-like protein 26 n=1 Tax=Macrobrachium nipponense TaxID=159736 RepID=UPI0030C7D3BF
MDEPTGKRLRISSYACAVITAQLDCAVITEPLQRGNRERQERNSGSIYPAVGSYGVESTIQQRVRDDVITTPVTLVESVRPPKDLGKDKNDEEIQRLRSDVCRLAGELNFMADKFEQHTEETDGLKKKIVAQQEKLQQWEKKNEEIEHQLERTNQTIVTLRRNISSQNNLIGSLKVEAMMRDRKIESLENVIVEKETVKRDSIIPHLESRLEELSFQCELLGADKKQMEERIEELQMDKSKTELENRGSDARQFESLVSWMENLSLNEWEETSKAEFDIDSLNKAVIQMMKLVNRQTLDQEDRSNARALIAELKRQRKTLGNNKADLAMKAHLDIHIHLLGKARGNRIKKEIEKLKECSCQKKTVLPTGLPEEEKTSVLPRFGLVPEIIPTMKDSIPMAQRETLKEELMGIFRDAVAPDEVPNYLGLTTNTSAVVPEQVASQRPNFRLTRSKFQEETDVIYNEWQDILKKQLMLDQYECQMERRRLKEWEQDLGTRQNGLKETENKLRKFLEQLRKYTMVDNERMLKQTEHLKEREENLSIRLKELEKKEKYMQEREQKELGQNDKYLLEWEENLIIRQNELGQKEKDLQEREQNMNMKHKELEQKEKDLQEMEQNVNIKQKILEQKDENLQELEQNFKQIKEEFQEWEHYMTLIRDSIARGKKKSQNEKEEDVFMAEEFPSTRQEEDVFMDDEFPSTRQEEDVFMAEEFPSTRQEEDVFMAEEFPSTRQEEDVFMDDEFHFSKSSRGGVFMA